MSEEKYDLHPSESDLDWENYTKHSGNDGCKKCTVVGAHEWINVCACCGKQFSGFDPEYQMEGEC